MAEKKKSSPKREASLNQGLQQAAAHGIPVSREVIKDLLTKDMKRVQILLFEILEADACVEALTDVMWKRYQAMMEAKKKAPDLFDDAPNQPVKEGGVDVR